MPEDFTLEIARGRDRADCFALRRQVFIEEQGVPEALELDGLDGEATLWIARSGYRTVGTARARIVSGVAKAERVAVPADRRGAGVGRSLMAAIEAWAASRGLQRVALSAQKTAIPFYLGLGYQAQGEVFEEAGIPHRTMEKSLAIPGN
jgi:ElaA protein